MPKKPAEVLQLAKEAGVKIVDLKFVDLPGSHGVGEAIAQ